MRLRMLIGLALTFLILGRPVARFIWQWTAKSRRHELYYYLLGALAIIVMLLLVSLNAYSQTISEAYDAPILVQKIPADARALAWTNCDSATNRPYIVIDSASWGTTETPYILVHERRHVSQALQFKGGCNAFLTLYDSIPLFKLQTEAEAECAEIASRPQSERNIRFVAIVALYETLPGYPRKEGIVLKEFQKACEREGLPPP